MRLLLDTHAIIWAAAEPEKIAREAREELEGEENDLWFSPISIWEILLLNEKNKLRLKPDPETGVRNLIRKLPMREAALNKEVAIVSRQINLPHQDPADRFLAATAIVYELTLATADRRLQGSNQYPVLAL